MDKDEQKESTHNDDSSDLSSSHDDAPVQRSFGMAYALSMVKKRNEQLQQTKQEEERVLEQERREKAREKARRRRQNQKLAKAKKREEATSKPNLDDPHAVSSNETTNLGTRDDSDSLAIEKSDDTVAEIVPIVDVAPKESLKRPNPFIPRALLLKKKQPR